eukprot:CAMPEP_0175392092 /NCGR_PEP_ID=MMETSP0095-20121207/32246_1 /TAXON_ID=311494 /ORGANISM="Alexandrium monilatum, Strain CCMP3105" /LENGTH=429 /DNA_ID=CAMNT_0016690663 /DNA_START=29 /DNA_END=1318 /DNA_ORIENTATION=+
MSLASMLSVLLECRFGAKLERLQRASRGGGEVARPAAGPGEVKSKQKGKQQPKEAKKELQEEQQQQQQPQDGEGVTSREWPALPVGAVSILLFMAAEVVACWSMFAPSAKAGRGPKAKAEAAEDPLGVLVEAVKAGVKKADAAKKRERPGDVNMVSSMERLVAVASESLTQREAFDAAHAMVMLVALLAVLISMLGRVVQPAVSGLFRGGRALPPRGTLVLVPLGLFGLLQWQSLAKTWKALQAEQLLPSLPRPLRIAALLLATPPQPGKAPEVPMFAALQAGSLVATISAEIAAGRFAVYIAHFSNDALLKAMVDSRVMAFLAPTMLALLWVSFVHLRRRKGFMMLAAVFSAVSSPAVVITCWKAAAPMLGHAEDPAAGLVRVLSIVHLVCGLSFFMAGGTITILSAMALGNLLVRIHGADVFGGLLF